MFPFRNVIAFIKKVSDQFAGFRSAKAPRPGRGEVLSLCGSVCSGEDPVHEEQHDPAGDTDGCCHEDAEERVDGCCHCDEDDEAGDAQGSRLGAEQGVPEAAEGLLDVGGRRVAEVSHENSLSGRCIIEETLNLYSYVAKL